MGLAAGGFGGWLLYTLDPSTAAGSFWLVVAGGLAVMLTVTVHPDGAVHLALKRTMGLRRVTSRIALLRGRRAFVEPLSELDEHTAPPRTLSVRDVVVRFGQVTAVDGVSFSVAPGEIVGLIGPNGAGKTTVIDAITGFVRPTAGSISLDDETIGSRPAYRRVRAGISRSFQSLELFEDSTVRENLRVASDRRELWRYFLDAAAPGRRPLSAAAVSALREFGLQGEIDERVSELPYGHRRLLAVVRAVAVHPSLLLLDEPVAGLGSVEVGELAVTIRRLARKWGMGILVVEHDMAFVMNICDRLVVLDFGKCIAEGTPVEVQANPAVISAYLGDADPQTPSPRRARAVSDKSGQ
jgi:sulfate-transporting ATPase